VITAEQNEVILSQKSRLARIYERITRSALDAGRSPHEIELICVSKNQTEANILTLLEAGERVFGENRVQEAQKKWPPLRSQYDVCLHLIGPLQTNKAEDAVQLFDVIETLDREACAKAIAKAIQKIGRQPRLYIEVNIGEEPQKAGILPHQSDDFIKHCRTNYGLSIEGLMCIPPAGQQAAPYFALLAEIAKRNGLQKLSMGMSADFEIAIQMGATSVRIGTALFGQR
jgi:pyridoxal phosphate enzyme (YggS family)